MIKIIGWLYDVVESLLLKIGKLYYYFLQKENPE